MRPFQVETLKYGCHIERDGQGGICLKKDNSVLSKKLTKDLDLLRRHVDMLLVVSKNEPIGIIKLAGILDIPEHKARYSLRLLEQDGLVEATQTGAMTTKKATKFLKELGGELGDMTDTISDIRQTLKNAD